MHVLFKSCGVLEIFIYISHGQSMRLFYYNESPYHMQCTHASCEASRKSTYYFIISFRIVSRIVVRCVINSSEPISMTFAPSHKESVEHSAICGSMYHQRDYDVVPGSIYKLMGGFHMKTSQSHKKRKLTKKCFEGNCHKWKPGQTEVCRYGHFKTKDKIQFCNWCQVKCEWLWWDLKCYTPVRYECLSVTMIKVNKRKMEMKMEHGTRDTWSMCLFVYIYIKIQYKPEKS